MKTLVPKITLDGVILFMFAVPFIMKYRISPGDTPYWLFTSIFLVLLSYFFVTNKSIKTILAWLVIFLTIGSALFSSIVWRHQVAPEFGAHDIILQLESAMRYTLDGVNPYKATYFGTPLEKWHYSDTEINPALYHFVMPPLYLLSAFPFYVVSNMFFGFFDGRMPLIFSFLVILGVLTIWVKKEDRPLALALFAFNPGTIDYFVEGRSDFAMLVFLVVSLFLLYKKRVLWSCLFLAMAFGVKQSIWPFFPLYFYFLFKEFNNKLISGTVVFGVTFFLIIAPFLFWDMQAFLDSTVLYLTSSGETNYPISGYGFGMLLHQMKIISDVHDYFPFTIFQLIAGIPVLIYLCIWLSKKPSVRNLMFAYGIFLFVFWYFSRYFNNSHIGFISSIFLIAYFIPETHEKKAH